MIFLLIVVGNKIFDIRWNSSANNNHQIVSNTPGRNNDITVAAGISISSR
jgi:hypothetical protein